MKVILYMAISLNGIIARENNEEDFLSHNNWLTFVELAHKTGCMIWGRKTHDVVRTWGKEYWNEIKDVKKVIVSSKTDSKLEEGCISATSPQDALTKLVKQGFDSVVLTGGSTLNSSFAKAGLIDEVIVNVEPVVIGKGIALFNPDDFDLNMELLKTKTLGHGIIQIRYKVRKTI